MTLDFRPKKSNVCSESTPTGRLPPQWLENPGIKATIIETNSSTGRCAVSLGLKHFPASPHSFGVGIWDGTFQASKKCETHDGVRSCPTQVATSADIFDGQDVV